VRAYKIAMTPPTLPVVIVADTDLQERPVPDHAQLHIPKLTLTAPPQGDSGAVAEAARLLVEAESPVLVADRAARTPAGLKHLVELAELLQAPVINQSGRMNFPSRHPLNQSDRSRSVIANADVILGLELADFWGTVNSLRDQLQRTDPPPRQCGKRSQVPGREPKPHHLLDKRGHLVEGEPEIGRAQLAHRIPRPQTWQRQRWIFPCRNDHMEQCGRLLQQEGDRIVDRACPDHLIVFEHENDVPPEGHELVHQEGQNPSWRWGK